MIDRQVSSYGVVAEFVGAARLPFTDRVNYEDGPIAFEDTTKGMFYQKWRARLISNTIWVTNPMLKETALYTRKCIKQISLSFDQNARYSLLYILENGDMWLYWYDTVLQSFAHTLLDTGVRDGQITVPDKRELLQPFSEVGIFYTKGTNLYYRGQFDRYTIPHLLAEGIGGRIIQVGFNEQLRTQIVFQQIPYSTYSCTLELNCL